MSLFDQTHLAIMEQGIYLFNAQKYWECHEELEHHWLEEPGPIRNVYWAVIQVAASMMSSALVLVLFRGNAFWPVAKRCTMTNGKMASS